MSSIDPKVLIEVMQNEVVGSARLQSPGSIVAKMFAVAFAPPESSERFGTKKA